MPLFLSLGVSKEEFFRSSPKDLECYLLAEEMRQKRQDEENWHMGMYNMSAFGVALAKALAGNKSHAKYIDKPLSEKVSDKKIEDENLTEEQKDRERDRLLCALMTMQANFELNHKSGGDA